MEKVLSNVDVLYSIFQYLDFDDHLQLINVCTQFRWFIKDFVWENKFKYANLEVTLENFKNYELSNNLDDGKLTKFENTKCYKNIITSDQINTILQVASSNIKVLKLYRPCWIEREIEFGFNIDDKSNFTNLVSMTYKRILLNEQDLKLLSKNCPKLENLCLDNCRTINAGYEKPFVIGCDLQLSIIQEMTVLKGFEIQSTDWKDEDFCYDITDFLTKLLLEQIIVNISKYVLTENHSISEKSNHPCKELKIGNFGSQSIFNTLTNIIFINFQNLQKLTLSTTRLIIKEDFFTKLSEKCNQLKYLNLSGFTIERFVPIFSLNELVFDDCEKLTWKDLKLILQDMNLKSFSLNSTYLIGEFEYFSIAPSLEYLHITNYPGNEIKNLFEMNSKESFKNLSSLTYYCNTTNNRYEVPINITRNCRQLKTLTTLTCYYLIDKLHRLKSLEELTLKLKTGIEFSTIRDILEHRSLKYLTIEPVQIDVDKNYDDNKLIVYDLMNYDDDVYDMETNLEYINLPESSFYYKDRDIWLSLLENNPKLFIVIRLYAGENNLDFLKGILFHDNFPQRIQSIKLFGYKIDLKELKEDFDNKIKQLLDKVSQIKDNEHYLML